MTAPVIQPATWHGVWTIMYSRPVHWKLKTSGLFGNGDFTTTKTFCWRDTYEKQQIQTFFLIKEQRHTRAVELQQQFYCTCIYDLLKIFADSPTFVTKLNFYKRKIQHLQTQKAIRTYVSQWEKFHSMWNLHLSPNQSTQTQTLTGNNDNS